MNFRKLELEDQPWFPKFLKEGMTDYLRFLFWVLDLYHPAVPLLDKAMQHCNASQVIDLCSGSGGPIEKISQNQRRSPGHKLIFILTDISPRQRAWQFLSCRNKNNITYVLQPVDATAVPASLKGFRTMFSGIHHFTPEEAKKVIGNAVNAGEGIAIFDGGDKNIFMIMLVIVFHPLALILFTPFIAPFRWTRLLFTYLLPLIPVGAVWDGIISIVNLYKPSELLQIAQSTTPAYQWQAGKLRNRFGLGITYLIGVPERF